MPYSPACKGIFTLLTPTLTVAVEVRLASSSSNAERHRRVAVTVVCSGATVSDNHVDP